MMKAQPKKAALKQSKAIAGRSPVRQVKEESEVKFEDRRPEAVGQRALSGKADGSLQVRRIAQLQAMADGSAVGTIQRLGLEEEEPLQGKFGTIQRQEEEEEQGSPIADDQFEDEENTAGRFRAGNRGVTEALGGSDVTDVAADAIGLTGQVGDYFGTGFGGPSPRADSNASVNYAQGGNISGLGGSIGVVVNTGTGVTSGAALYKNIKKQKKIKTQLDQERAQLEQHPELFASVKLLEKQQKQEARGIAENSVGVVAAINGFINGISTIAGNAMAGAVTFGIGQGINAVLGIINAVRDMFVVAKRHESQKQIAAVMEAYEHIFNTNQAQLAEAQVQMVQNPSVEQPDRIVPNLTEVASVIESATAMNQGLKVSSRKHNKKGKVGSAVMNTAGAAGGIAMIVATATTAATMATPVGWILGAAAGLGALVYSIGMATKRAIRKSNVTRMKQERTVIFQAIQNGEKSEDDAWNRQDFPTEETKGWFNRLVSKDKSGTISLGERITKLNEYLQKYDILSAGEAVHNGFIKALFEDEGDNQVPGPADGQMIPLRKKIRLLIAYYLGVLDDPETIDRESDEVSHFIMPLDPGNDMPEAAKKAKKYLMDKLKLGSA